jgi:hypothetical protein
MIIRCFSDFADSQRFKIIFENLKEFFINNNENINLTTEEDYTHVIIFNIATPNISHIPKKNVLGIAKEPVPFLNINSYFIEYAQKYIGTYFIGDKMDLPEPFIESNSYLFFNPPVPSSVIPYPNKKNRMSIMFSEKQHSIGHKYRYSLIEQILERKIPIDIYGRGCLCYIGDPDSRIKGEFDHCSVMFNDYEFTISIENFVSNHYFSEKVINPLLYQTIPIYLGCRNIESYFPGQTIRLSGEIKTDILLIIDILSFPEKYRRIIDIPLIKSKINLLKDVTHLYSSNSFNNTI